MADESVLIWDLETVPDLTAMARIHGRAKMTSAEVRNQLAGEFPKLPVHQIVCIGALIASNAGSGWQVESLGAPHSGLRTEKELIAAFIERIGSLRPKLVTFNGDTFDLPVLRYRAMLYRLSAAPLHARAYFNRYADDAVDLCDVLASYNGRAKVTLDLLCKSLGLSGKTAGISGADVENFYLAGRVQEIADYCEVDVVNTYRVWLLYELFQGRLSDVGWQASESNLKMFVTERLQSKPHLGAILQSFSSEPI